MSMQKSVELRKFDVRAIVDDRNEKIGRKIRQRNEAYSLYADCR